VEYQANATVYLNTILFAAQGENNIINYETAHNIMASHNHAKEKVRPISSS